MSRKQIGRWENWQLQKIGGLNEQLMVGEDGTWQTAVGNGKFDVRNVEVNGASHARRVQIEHRVAGSIVSTTVVVRPGEFQSSPPMVELLHFDGEESSRYDSADRKHNRFLAGQPQGIVRALRVLEEVVALQHVQMQTTPTEVAQHTHED
jgi:hypothetical protein